MRINRFLSGALRWLGALLVAGGLAACSSTRAPESAATAPAPGAAQPTTAPTIAAPPTVPAAAPTSEGATPAGDAPLAAAFPGLDEALSKALGVPVTAGQAVFEDFITGSKVSSYRLTAQGTGANLQDMAAISTRLESMFGGLGWQQDVTYGATGVASSTIGYRQGTRLSVVTVAVRASDDAGCPKGTPIVDCNLRPEQMLFTVTLECMLRD